MPERFFVKCPYLQAFWLSHVGDGGMLSINWTPTPKRSPTTPAVGCSARGAGQRGERCTERSGTAVGWRRPGKRSGGVLLFVMISAAAGLRTWYVTLYPSSAPYRRTMERDSFFSPPHSLVTKWVSQKLNAWYCKSLSLQGSLPVMCMK